MVLVEMSVTNPTAQSASPLPDERAILAHEAKLATFPVELKALDDRRDALLAERDDRIRAAAAAKMSQSKIAALARVHKSNVGFIVRRLNTPRRPLRTTGRAFEHDPEQLRAVAAQIKVLRDHRHDLLVRRDQTLIDGAVRLKIKQERMGDLTEMTRSSVNLIVKPFLPHPSG